MEMNINNIRASLNKNNREFIRTLFGFIFTFTLWHLLDNILDDEIKNLNINKEDLNKIYLGFLVINILLLYLINR
jgi:hypothetical protein